jgi:acetamidase/formamidase
MEDRYINIMRAIAVITVIVLLLVGFSYDMDNYAEQTKWTQQKPISFPEEIYLAEPGDTLVVEKVSDSIYIRYR